MIRAVLLDLDDTLIRDSRPSFVQAFIQLADATLAPRLGVPSLRPAFEHMMHRLQAERTAIQANLVLITHTIAEVTCQPPHVVQAALDAFYAHDYPRLQPYIHRVPDSQTLVQALLDQQIIVVIATNPIYPAPAIQQRLAWGQVDVSGAAFITDASAMHFAKPDPAYYAEIIARVGVEPDEALMIGDHAINDVQAAQAAGLHALHVDRTRDERLEPALALVRSTGWRSAFPVHDLPPEAILHGLRANLGALAGLIDQAPPHTWHQRPLPGEWSLLQIVTHLVQSEIDTQRARIETILHHDDPSTLPQLVDIAGDANIVPPVGFSLYDLFNHYCQQRQQTLRLLQALAPSDWDRRAHHSVFGYTTLREMAAFTAQHDRMHIQQFCQTLGRCQEE